MESETDTPAPLVVYRALAELENIDNDSKRKEKYNNSRNRNSTHLSAIPSYQLYKVAREEELITFRGVVRVLTMHYGSTLPKHTRRLLEDLAEELCIPSERVELETEMANNDAFIDQLISSEVLTERCHYFDGVDDVPIVDTDKRVGIEDDGNVIGIDKEKYERMVANQQGTSVDATNAACSAVNANTSNAHIMQQGSSNGTAHASSSAQDNEIASVMYNANPSVKNSANSSNSNLGIKRRRSSSAIFQASVSKLGREIEQTAQEYLYATDSRLQSTLRKTLELKRDALLQLREEMTETIV